MGQECGEGTFHWRKTGVGVNWTMELGKGLEVTLRSSGILGTRYEASTLREKVVFTPRLSDLGFNIRAGTSKDPIGGIGTPFVTTDIAFMNKAYVVEIDRLCGYFMAGDRTLAKSTYKRGAVVSTATFEPLKEWNDDDPPTWLVAAITLLLLILSYDVVAPTV